MEIIKSKLNINQSVLLQYYYEFISDETIDFDNVDLSELFNDYKVDINFEFRTRGNDFEIVVSAVVNVDKSFGYFIDIKLATVFSFNEEVNKEEERVYWIQTAIGVTINKVREKIIHFTGHCPLITYELPLINLNDLINKKNTIVTRQIEEQELKKKESNQ